MVCYLKSNGKTFTWILLVKLNFEFHLKQESRFMQVEYFKIFTVIYIQ